MLNFKVGDDNGNSTKKIIINGEKIVQPNVIAFVAKKPNTDGWAENVIEDLENNLIISVQDEDGEFDEINFIGNYAMKSGQSITNLDISNPEDKVESEVSVLTTLGFIAAKAIKDKYKDGGVNGVIDVTVDMATSIPVKLYSKERANELAEKFMDNEFVVRVYIHENKYIDVKIKFELVKVIPEGVTSMYYLINADEDIFDEYNKGNDRLDVRFFRDPSKEILHIAIGEGTTEFPKTKECNDWDENFITGTDAGVGNALEEVGKILAKEGRSGFLDRQKLSDIIKDPTNKFYDEVKTYAKAGLKSQAKSILQSTRGELKKCSNLDMILVYGGGSILMRKYLEKQLEKEASKNKAKLFYIRENYSTMIEALGLYEFVNLEIFEKLKEAKLKK